MTDDQEQAFDPGFRIVDKREAARSEQPPAAEAAAETAEPASAEEPQGEPLDIHGIVHYCVNVLSGHAWQSMGLITDPITHKVERDLAQARLAIDCVEALLERAEQTMPREQAERARQLLNDLRMNYVRQASRAE